MRALDAQDSGRLGILGRVVETGRSTFQRAKRLVSAPCRPGYGAARGHSSDGSRSRKAGQIAFKVKQRSAFSWLCVGILRCEISLAYMVAKLIALRPRDLWTAEFAAGSHSWRLQQLLEASGWCAQIPSFSFLWSGRASANESESVAVVEDAENVSPLAEGRGQQRDATPRKPSTPAAPATIGAANSVDAPSSGGPVTFETVLALLDDRPAARPPPYLGRAPALAAPRTSGDAARARIASRPREFEREGAPQSTAPSKTTPVTSQEPRTASAARGDADGASMPAPRVSAARPGALAFGSLFGSRAAAPASLPSRRMPSLRTPSLRPGHGASAPLPAGPSFGIRRDPAAVWTPMTSFSKPLQVRQCTSASAEHLSVRVPWSTVHDGTW